MALQLDDNLIRDGRLPGRLRSRTCAAAMVIAPGPTKGCRHVILVVAEEVEDCSNRPGVEDEFSHGSDDSDNGPVSDVAPRRELLGSRVAFGHLAGPAEDPHLSLSPDRAGRLGSTVGQAASLC